MGAKREKLIRGVTSGRWAAIGVAFSVLAVGRAVGQDAAATADAVPDYVEEFEAREFRAPNGEVLRYRLLRPLDGDADQRDSSRRYPLIIFLHGAGERGDDNVSQLANGGRQMADAAFRHRHPAFIMVPQCPDDRGWSSNILMNSRYSDEITPQPLDFTLEAVDALRKELPVDATRIYAIGLSMGCDGVYEILHYKPKLLAAGVTFAGYSDLGAAEAIARTPLWIFHGADDDLVPVDEVRGMVQALREAGGAPNYTEYPGVGHGAWTPALVNRLMWDWLFAQRRRCELVGEALPDHPPAAISVGDLRGHRAAKIQLIVGAAASFVGAVIVGVCVRRGG